jgi:hypothetical protein
MSNAEVTYRRLKCGGPAAAPDAGSGGSEPITEKQARGHVETVTDSNFEDAAAARARVAS